MQGDSQSQDQREVAGRLWRREVEKAASDVTSTEKEEDTKEGLGRSLEKMLRVSGGSKAEKARILCEMLASLEDDGKEESSLPIAADGALTDVVNEMETDVSGSNANKMYTPGEELCAQYFSGNGKGGDKAEQGVNKDYPPGDDPSDPG